MADEPAAQPKFTETRRRPPPGTLLVIVLFHLLVLYGLAKALAPDFTGAVEKTVMEAFTVTITTPPDKMPEPEPDAGLAGDQGREAVPKPTAAPSPKVAVAKPKPAPRASSTGAANDSGASDSGQGTGASGSGPGTGGGNGGGGTGGGIAVNPSVRAGELDTASDFPIPPGGRQSRFGKSVIVVFTVTTDGRARNCTIARSEVDPATAASVCPLVERKVRFNPARLADGTPVEARYGYRVDFKPL